MERIIEDVYIGHSAMRLLGVNLQRCYTVLRHGGSLTVLSPTDSMDLDGMGGLGEVAHIVAPTCFHDTGMQTAAEAFPDATLWGVSGVAEHLPGMKLQELSGDRFPGEWLDTIQCFPLKGMPKVNEHVIWHQPSHTLITSDLVFNIQPPVDVWTRLFFQMNGAWQKPGPTKIFRACIKNPEAFATSIQVLKNLPVKRILPAHGAPITKPAEIAQTLARL